jgi:hypothetical protein
MLSSSHSKIHEPPVTGVSRRPPDRRPAAAKLRNTRARDDRLAPERHHRHPACAGIVATDVAVELV